MKPNTEIKTPDQTKTVDEIAAEIKSLSDGIKKLNNGPMKRRAVLVLLRDSISGKPMSLNEIDRVLDAAADLHRYYLKS